MKFQTPKDYLVELVSYAPPEEQQALRSELKSLQFSPMLAALIAQRLETIVRESKVVVSDAGLSSKLDTIMDRHATIEKRLEQADIPGSTGIAPKSVMQLGEHVKGLREDMRGVQDDLAALRPYHRTKILWLITAVFVAGCVSGWHLRIEYAAWADSRMQEGS